MKKIISLILIFSMIFGVTVAFAGDSISSKEGLDASLEFALLNGWKTISERKLPEGIVPIPVNSMEEANQLLHSSSTKISILQRIKCNHLYDNMVFNEKEFEIQSTFGNFTRFIT